MAMLASRYKDGVGVKQSDKKAIELYEMAASIANGSTVVIIIVIFIS